MILVDRFLLPILGVGCVAFFALAVGAEVQMHKAIERAATSAQIAHDAIARERVWRASAMAVATGSRDTDDALKSSRYDLAICVGQFLKVEAALERQR